MKLKKWMINISLISIVAMPVATMVSCRSDSNQEFNDAAIVAKVKNYFDIFWEGVSVSPFYTEDITGDKNFIADEKEKIFDRTTFKEETGLDPLPGLTAEYLNDTKVTYWVEKGPVVVGNLNTYLATFRIQRGRSSTELTRQIRVYDNERDKTFYEFIGRNEKGIRNGFAFGRNGFDIKKVFEKYEPKPNAVHLEVPMAEFVKHIPLKGTLPTGYSMKIFVYSPIVQDITRPIGSDSAYGYAYPVQLNFYNKRLGDNPTDNLDIKVANISTFFYSSELEKKTSSGTGLEEYSASDETNAQLIKEIARLTYSSDVITNAAVPDLVPHEVVVSPMNKFNIMPLLVSTFGLRMKYIYDSSDPINETNKGRVTDVNLKLRVEKDSVSAEHPFKVNFDPNEDIDVSEAEAWNVYEKFYKRFADSDGVRHTFISMLNAVGIPGIEEGLDDLLAQSAVKPIPIDQFIKRTKLNEQTTTGGFVKTVELPTYNTSFANVAFKVENYYDPDIPNAHQGVVGKKYLFTIIVSREYIQPREVKFVVTSRDYLAPKN